jgi:Nickel responsive protein SCO4226-like
MPRYVIERNLPGAGQLGPEKLRSVAERSCSVLRELGSEIQWVESYVTDDKIYCIYIAANEELIREHARRGGFPANRISQVRQVISPLTAEATQEP